MADSLGIRAGRAFVELSIKDSAFNASLKKNAKAIENFGKNMSNKAIVRLQVGATVSAPIVLATKIFADFDDQMRITQAVSSSTGAMFEKLSEQAKHLGATTSFTAAQVASAMAGLGRGGFSGEEISQSIAAVMDLSRATATDIPVAVDIATNALRAFGLETSQMGLVCDVLTATANGSAQTLEDLGEAFKYVAPIAAQSGQSLEDTAKIVGALANFGIKGSMAGTAFKNIATRSADPTVQAKYAEIGVKTTNEDGSLRKIADILRDVANATKEMPNAERLAIFKELFGMFGLAGGAALTAGADFESLYNAIDNASGKAAETAKTMDEGLGGAIRITLSAVEGLAIAVGNSLTPFLSELGDKIQKIANWFSVFASENQNLIVKTVKWALKLTALNAALFIIGKAVQSASYRFQFFTSLIRGYSFIISKITGATKAAAAATAAKVAVEKAEVAVTAAKNAITKALTQTQFLAAQATLAQAQNDLIAAQNAEKNAVAIANKTAKSAAYLAVAGVLVVAVAALAAGVVYLANSYKKASDEARKATDAAKAQADANKAQRDADDELMEKLIALSQKSNLTNEEFAEGCNIAKALQDRYGDLGITIDETTKSFKGLAEAQRKYEEAKTAREQAGLQNQINANNAEKAKLEREKNGLMNSTAAAAGRTISGAINGHGLHGVQDRMGEILDREDALNNETKALQQQLDASKAVQEARNQDKKENEEKEQTTGVPAVSRDALDKAKETVAQYNDARQTPYERRLNDASKQYGDFIGAQKTIRDYAIQNANGDENAVARANQAYADAIKPAQEEFQKQVEEINFDEAKENIEKYAEELKEAQKTGDADKIAAAEENLENAKNDALENDVSQAKIDEIVDGALNAAETQKEIASSGTFDALEAFDMTNDWEKEAMEKQTAVLEKIKDSASAIADVLNQNEQDEDLV